MSISFLPVMLFFLLFTASGHPAKLNNWIVEKHAGYRLLYTETDKKNMDEYLPFIENGIRSVRHFFDAEFKDEFEIYIHPDRLSLDNQWAKDWHMPDFKSECWMVASGVANKLDIISPKYWDKESCEHSFKNRTATQQLIIHELVHVFHGQLNISPDFSDASGIDWFVEGLATFASGQCDETRLNEIGKALSENEIPRSLDSFWTGKLRYGLSGSLVMYIDSRYGRARLKELLQFSRKSELLMSLGITEANLLTGWEQFIKTL